jgi:hypothetical protein
MPSAATSRRQRVHEGDLGRLGGVVRGRAPALATVDGADDEDAPPTPLTHGSKCELRHPDGRIEVYVHRLGELGGTGVRPARAGATAEVVDQDLDVADGLAGGRIGARAPRLGREVRNHGLAARHGRGVAELLLAAGDHRHLGALTGERRRDREPDPAAGAGDERRASLDA